MAGKKFSGRAFVSMLITIQGLLITITGLVLYIAPPGRVANWSNWTLIGLTKTQWQAVHTVFSFLFVIFAGFHLYYNWKPFVNYIISKIEGGLNKTREMGLAFSLTLIIFVVTVMNIPPVSLVMDAGEYLSDSWATEETEPPIPHAELMTLSEFMREVEVEPEKGFTQLKLAKINDVTPQMTLQQVADKYGMTPSEVGDIITKAKSDHQPPITGMGRMSLEEVCNRLGIDPETVVEKLSKNNIAASTEMTLKEIADQIGKRPFDIYQIIIGEENS
ncbi:MAG: DUF4405 domain-containing protein [Calditrichia bacterium]